MKLPSTLASFCLLALLSAPLFAAQTGTNELTGILHLEKMKTPKYLEIDGTGFIERIIVTGNALKGIPDGARVWVKGNITTHLFGSQDPAKLQNQQAATQWFIIFHVDQCKQTTKPFETPTAMRN